MTPIPRAGKSGAGPPPPIPGKSGVGVGVGIGGSVPCPGGWRQDRVWYSHGMSIPDFPIFGQTDLSSNRE